MLDIDEVIMLLYHRKAVIKLPASPQGVKTYRDTCSFTTDLLWAKPVALIISYHIRGFVEEEKNE